MSLQFIGGSAAQHTAIGSAHSELALAVDALSTPLLTPQVTRLFGTQVSAESISSVFVKVKTALNNVTFVYDLNTNLPFLLRIGVFVQFDTVNGNHVNARTATDLWTGLSLEPETFQLRLILSIFHELGICFAGLEDFSFPTSNCSVFGPFGYDGSEALSPLDSASALVAVGNFMSLVAAYLANPTPVSPNGGLAVASPNSVQFYSTLTGDAIGLQVLMQNGSLTATPGELGRIAVFGEGNTPGMSELHAFDVYLQKDLLIAGSQLPGSVDSTPAIIGNTAWLCTGNGTLIQADMSTPSSPNVTPVLAYATGTAADRITACLLSDDEQTLYATGTTGAYAITLATPAVNWSVTTTDFSSVPSVLAGNQLVAANGTKLYCMSSANPTTISLSTTISTLRATGSQHVLVNGAADSFSVVDTITNVITTITPGLSNIQYDTCLVVGNSVFVSNTANKLACYQYLFIDQADTWSLLWEITLSNSVVVAPSFSNGFLYVLDAGNSATLSVLDALTGYVLWTKTNLSVPSTTPLSVTPLVDSNDAALYSSAHYGGNPTLLSSAPSPFPSVTGCLPGPLSYTMFSATSQIVGEAVSPSPNVSLTSVPNAANAVTLNTVQTALNAVNVPIETNWLGLTTSWLRALTDNQYALWFVIDSTNSVFGPNVAMLDFSGSSLTLARRVAGVVQLGGAGSSVPDSVEQSLAMSGSTAQDAVQANPGDLDFTQRIHITAQTQAEAQSILGQIVKTRVTTTPSISGVTAEFIELKFGVYPFDFQATGSSSVNPAGSPISWSAADVTAGQIVGTNTTTSMPAVISWDDAASNPVWIKFDYIFAIPGNNDVLNTSNVLDPTWVNSLSQISTLDVSQDAFIQEIYLDLSTAPLCATLFNAIGKDLREPYLEQLALEVKKFGVPGKKKYNLGKVAKRLYNLTRMNGRFVDAAFLRAVFGAPITVVYMVWSRVKGIGEAALETSIPPTDIEKQVTALIQDVQSESSLDPSKSSALITDLNAIKTALNTLPLPSNFPTTIDTCLTNALAWVNTEFGPMLQGMPGLYAYYQQLIQQTVTSAYVLQNFPQIFEHTDDWDELL